MSKTRVELKELLKREQVIIETKILSLITNVQFLASLSEQQISRHGLEEALPELENAYLALSQSKGQLHQQLRLLGPNGQELIRVDRNKSGEHAPLPKDKLQNKGDRYYFYETQQLRGLTYLSPLDLNMEQGKIERPFLPMLRIAKSIYTDAGENQGVIVLNYAIGNDIKRLLHINESDSKSVFLINPQGYWLVGPTRDDEWGFMLEGRSDKRFINRFPSSWEQMGSFSSGTHFNSEGLFAYEPISLLNNSIQDWSTIHGHSAEQWLLIAHIPAEKLVPAWLGTMISVYTGILLVLAGILYSAAKHRGQRNLAFQQLRQSETRFEQALLNAPLPAVLHNEQGKFLLLNHAWQDISGYSVDETPTIEQWLKRAFSQSEVPMERLKRLFMVNQARFPEELALTTADGNQLFWEFTSAPLGSVDGQRLLLTMAVDSTARRHAEQQLRQHQLNLEQEVKERTGELEQANKQLRDEIKDRIEAEHTTQKFMRVIEECPVSVIITNKDGNIEYINPMFTQLTGYSTNEVIGKNPSILQSGLHDKTFYKNLWQTITSGKVWRGDLTNKCKDGSLICESTAIAPLLDEHNEIINYVGVKADISERKRLEEGLVQAKLEAEAHNQAKSSFLAMMSHEIRTPMNAIIGMTHLAQQKNPEEELNGFLQKIMTAAKGLLGIINDILDYSKIESDKMDIENVSFSLTELLDNIVNILGPKADEKQINLFIGCASDIPESLKGDPLRLGQVLTNLINNAIKFTEIGTVELWIKLSKEEPGSVIFSIKDTGIGINSEQQKKLFSPFMQADSSISRRFGGTGLGLAISSKLVEQMGGKLQVESKINQGSHFYFSLPILTETELPVEKPLLPLAEYHVWILSADTRSATNLKWQLTNFGISPEVFTTPQQLINKLSDMPPNLLIIDEYTELDLTQLSQDTPPPDNFFLRITSHSELGRIKDCSHILEKPFTPSTLLDTLLEQFGLMKRARTKQEVTQVNIPDLSAYHLLLAEDNQVNQEVAKGLLEPTGVKLTIVNNGQEAVEAIAQSTFDLVLMDIQMPVLDGLSACQKIRSLGKKDKRLSQTPVIAMTAHAMKTDIEKSHAAGMNDHLTKPIDPSTMYQLLGQWLNSPIQPSTRKPEQESDIVTKHKATEKGAASISHQTLDTTDGINRVGSEKTYTKILNLFIQQFELSAEKINESLNSHDKTIAQHLAHSVKGGAGNIGAKKLMKLSSTLEEQIATDKKDAAFITLEAFSKELHTVLSSINEWLADNSEDAPTETTKQQLDLEKSELLDQLQQLQLFLDNDINAAFELFNMLESAFSKSQLEENYNKIKSEINQFNMTAAKTSVKEVQQRLG